MEQYLENEQLCAIKMDLWSLEYLPNGLRMAFHLTLSLDSLSSFFIRLCNIGSSQIALEIRSQYIHFSAKKISYQEQNQTWKYLDLLYLSLLKRFRGYHFLSMSQEGRFSAIFVVPKQAKISNLSEFHYTYKNKQQFSFLKEWLVKRTCLAGLTNRVPLIFLLQKYFNCPISSSSIP